MGGLFLEGGASSASAAVTELLSIGSTCVSWIMENSLLSVVFAGCLIPVAFRIIKSAKNAAKN
ncbi:MAG: hypothetical protein E7271_05065 [Lachnospiraceae bacterium]|jgi:phosphoribosylcarboxyaminoimidazole (NCAIR) mutase|nr:hypothetical protein [Lachnospiraceae bacterium]